MLEKENKELIRLASLVGTDAKNPETKLIEIINKNILLVEKETVERMQGLVQDYFKNVLQAPCPDFRFNYHNKFVQGKK